MASLINTNPIIDDGGGYKLKLRGIMSLSSSSGTISAGEGLGGKGQLLVLVIYRSISYTATNKVIVDGIEVEAKNFVVGSDTQNYLYIRIPAFYSIQIPTTENYTGTLMVYDLY